MAVRRGARTVPHSCGVLSITPRTRERVRLQGVQRPTSARQPRPQPPCSPFRPCDPRILQAGGASAPGPAMLPAGAPSCPSQEPPLGPGPEAGAAWPQPVAAAWPPWSTAPPQAEAGPPTADPPALPGGPPRPWAPTTGSAPLPPHLPLHTGAWRGWQAWAELAGKQRAGACAREQCYCR